MKLDFNELGYNEHSVIPNEQNIQSQMTILQHIISQL